MLYIYDLKSNNSTITDDLNGLQDPVHTVKYKDVNSIEKCPVLQEYSTQYLDYI